MSPEQQASLDAELTLAEGTKAFAYDDATGSRIVPGYTVRGNVTGGIGINLQFLYPEEVTWLLHNRERRAIAVLNGRFPGFPTLDPVRQNAIIDLYYNIPAFLKWPNFMGYARAVDWPAAADELLATYPWIDQVGQRGVRIASELRTGVVAGT
jgi:GH24 family phage-related lysozyme (muramidase)